MPLQPNDLMDRTHGGAVVVAGFSSDLAAVSLDGDLGLRALGATKRQV